MNWTVSDVQNWLLENSLGECQAVFLRHGVDGPALLRLGPAEASRLGVSSIRTRNHLLTCVGELQKAVSSVGAGAVRGFGESRFSSSTSGRAPHSGGSCALPSGATVRPVSPSKGTTYPGGEGVHTKRYLQGQSPSSVPLGGRSPSPQPKSPKPSELLGRQPDGRAKVSPRFGGAAPRTAGTPPAGCGQGNCSSSSAPAPPTIGITPSSSSPSTAEDIVADGPVGEARKQLKAISLGVESLQQRLSSRALSPLRNRDGEVEPEVEKARKAYEEELMRHLMKVDGVESHGDPAIRTMRKQLVVEVQQKLDDYDRYRNSDEGRGPDC
eukprot:RCo044388